MSKESEELFQKFMNNASTVCPRCGSTNCQFNLALEEQERSTGEGCFLYYMAIILLLFIPVIGWILLYAIVNEKRKRKSVTYVLCNNCGNSWKLVSDEEKNKLQKKKELKTNSYCFIYYSFTCWSSYPILFYGKIQRLDLINT